MSRGGPGHDGFDLDLDKSGKLRLNVDQELDPYFFGFDLRTMTEGNKFAVSLRPLESVRKSSVTACINGQTVIIVALISTKITILWG